LQIEFDLGRSWDIIERCRDGGLLRWFVGEMAPWASHEGIDWQVLRRHDFVSSVKLCPHPKMASI